MNQQDADLIARVLSNCGEIVDEQALEAITELFAEALKDTHRFGLLRFLVLSAPEDRNPFAWVQMEDVATVEETIKYL